MDEFQHCLVACLVAVAWIASFVMIVYQLITGKSNAVSMSSSDTVCDDSQEDSCDKDRWKDWWLEGYRRGQDKYRDDNGSVTHSIDDEDDSISTHSKSASSSSSSSTASIPLQKAFRTWGTENKKDPPGAIPCLKNQIRCGTKCVTIGQDNDNCGLCGRACMIGTSCCNGDCVDFQTDRDHCSACGIACGPDQGCCNGECKDLMSDPKNCGECARTCAAGEICQDGHCVDPNSRSHALNLMRKRIVLPEIPTPERMSISKRVPAPPSDAFRREGKELPEDE